MPGRCSGADRLDIISRPLFGGLNDQLQSIPAAGLSGGRA